MKAVRVMKPGDLRVVDEEKPVLDSENNVMIRMTAAGENERLIESDEWNLEDETACD